MVAKRVKILGTARVIGLLTPSPSRMAIRISFIKNQVFYSSPGGMVGEDSVKILAIRVIGCSVGIEIEEKPGQPEAGFLKQREHFRVFDPADRLPGFVGGGWISGQRIAMLAVEKLFSAIEAVAGVQQSFATVGQGGLVIGIPLVFRQVSQ